MSTETPFETPAQQIIEQTHDLPTAPPVLFKLMSMLKKEVQHNSEIVEIIRYDEHLTAKLLKLCNSALFKSNNSITSVDQVVLRLGYSNILSIAVSLRVGDVVTKTKRAAYINPYDLWRHSVTSAITAKILVSKLKEEMGVKSDTGFTAALLHDIGKMVINAAPIENIPSIKEIVQGQGMTFLDAERQVLGTDHAEIGGLLMEKWNLPSEIVSAVRYHHFPEKSEELLPSLCHLSSLCARINMGLNTPDQLYALARKEALERLGLTIKDVEEALEKVREEATQIETFMMVA
jgi:putative nucleotidyltransferase with HDIG domain